MQTPSLPGPRLFPRVLTPMYRVLFALQLAFAGLSFLLAGPPPAKPYKPRVLGPSDEGKRALKRIRVPEGLKVDLFAAEPLLANPVSFCIDNQNRFYVAETFRIHRGVTDIRGHMDWLDDDLASRTVADRVALLKRRLGKKAPAWAVEHDRVRLVEDTDGDGKADRSVVFADGFHDLETGIGAGVLARGRDVWYTCIPDLWRLRDTKGTGRADVRERLHTGYGVHIGYYGHDLHGLTFGPDGKLYFSIGDRGLHVKTKEGKVIDHPDAGCVLRCNPDGTELEVYATGLRNPQELAFDDHGNLFTGDNNADSGDKARWVYVVQGGDSGWRTGYQYPSALGSRGPWNAEKLWHLAHEDQAAYVVPPVAHVADGPAGLAFYPGLGLPARYDGHFFLCDFRGASGQSGIRSFAVEPRGASFEMVDQHEFVWGVLATDVDFGTDCALYLTDWVDGWGLTGKGRIYKVSDPKVAKSPAARAVKKLLAEGMAGRKPAELARLLGHRDRRVRQEAQFELAGRGKDSLPTLAKVAREGKGLLPRLHALWGLGQVGRNEPAAFRVVLGLLGDDESEVRAQSARVLGDGKVSAALDRLIGLLKDRAPRVRFFAAQALARLGRKEAVAPVLAMVRAKDRDAYLRHAGVMALAGCADEEALREAARDDSPAVRRAVLLAWRRRGSPEVARFLDDPDAGLVLEAARAINDVPINAALPKLAGLATRPALPDFLGFRVLNANFRLGKAEHASAVARVAARSDVSEALRVEALRELALWAKPPGRDRVMGLWRPLPAREARLAVEALRPSLGALFSGPDRVRQEAARVSARLGVKEVGPVLLGMVEDTKRPGRVRVEGLKALAALKDPRLEKGLRLALRDPDPRVRTEGLRVLSHRKPAEALVELKKIVEEGGVAERQGAFAVLGEMEGEIPTAILSRALDDLLAGKLPAEVRLDLVEAAGRHPTPAIKSKLARYESARKGDRLGRWRDSLAGGDAESGRRIFFTKAEVSCVRCHKVDGVGGEVGPDLTGVGSRQKREYLLESLVDPNAQIAKGYETVVLTLADGRTVSGVLRGEDARSYRLMTPEGKPLVVAKSKVEERQAGKSAMPEDVTKYLTRAEVRDLVEFLAGLKESKGGRR